MDYCTSNGHHITGITLKSCKWHCQQAKEGEDILGMMKSSMDTSRTELYIRHHAHHDENQPREDS